MNTSTVVRSIASCIALVALACDGASPSPDGGADAASALDAGRVPDAATDAPVDGGGCIAVEVEGWALELADDVSIVYRARFTPTFETPPWNLYLQFNRYALEYVGEFPLGEGPEADYGTCARCVIAFQGAGFSEDAFFARSGTLVVRRDPFGHQLDASLRDVMLEEVRLVGPTLEAQTVPGGRCLTLSEADVDGTFPPAAWSCPDEAFGDGVTCNCGCGIADPDCGSRCTLPPEPGCDPTPLPIMGCVAGDLCTYESECSETCDHSARVGCESGVCGFSSDGDRCFRPGVDRISPATVGTPCAPADRAYHCAVDAEGFAMGLCDPDDAWLCRPTCERDEDCAPSEICWSYFIDPASGAGQGVCKPAPPPCIEAGGSCADHLDCCSVLCEGLGGGATEGTCA